MPEAKRATAGSCATDAARAAYPAGQAAPAADLVSGRIEVLGDRGVAIGQIEGRVLLGRHDDLQVPHRGAANLGHQPVRPGRDLPELVDLAYLEVGAP